MRAVVTVQAPWQAVLQRLLRTLREKGFETRRTFDLQLARKLLRGSEEEPSPTMGRHRAAVSTSCCRSAVTIGASLWLSSTDTTGQRVSHSWRVRLRKRGGAWRRRCTERSSICRWQVRPDAGPKDMTLATEELVPMQLLSNNHLKERRHMSDHDLMSQEGGAPSNKPIPGTGKWSELFRSRFFPIGVTAVVLGAGLLLARKLGIGGSVLPGVALVAFMMVSHSLIHRGHGSPGSQRSSGDAKKDPGTSEPPRPHQGCH